MTIEITWPEVEAIINVRLRSGAFQDAQDVILQALRSSAPETLAACANANDLIGLFEPVRGLLRDEEIDVLFRRNPSTGRPTDLA